MTHATIRRAVLHSPLLYDLSLLVDDADEGYYVNRFECRAGEWREWHDDARLHPVSDLTVRTLVLNALRDAGEPVSTEDVKQGYAVLLGDSSCESWPGPLSKAS